MTALSAFTFAQPWILLGLLTLPLLWWLLRATPPVPKRTPFPPIRILRSLGETEETPANTPWWLLLLRLIIAALIILALAVPLLNPGEKLAGKGPVLAVVDNGWAAAHRWQDRLDGLTQLLEQAAREDRQLILLPTAPTAASGALTRSGLMTAADLLPRIEAMKPAPWPKQYDKALAELDTLPDLPDAAIVWFADGIDSPALERFAETLAARGPLTIHVDPPADRAHLLRWRQDGRSLGVEVIRTDGAVAAEVGLKAEGARGQLIAEETVTFPEGALQALLPLDLPAESRNRVHRIVIETEQTAGGTLLLDESWRRRPVGLVSGDSSERRTQPLLSNLHYLQRALEASAEVQVGDLQRLLQEPLSTLVLADIGRLEDNTRAQLANWVKKGGVLIRFAGPRLANAQSAERPVNSETTLLPVDLRRGGRALGGSMTWGAPTGLAAFDDQSPFAGLAIPGDVRIRRQVLAEPALDLHEKTWARLTDGTPLVTGTRSENGWLVLFHITANADWSNLPLSGLFEGMLKRLGRLSEGVAGDVEQGKLPPYSVLNGEGQLITPYPWALPLILGGPENTAEDDTEAVVKPEGNRISAVNPPGFYGTESARYALNLGPELSEHVAFDNWPGGAVLTDYIGEDSVPLKPWLLTAALLLALIDTVIMLVLSGLLRFGRVGMNRATAGMGLILVAGYMAYTASQPAQAQTIQGDSSLDDSFALQAALQTRLAYVRSNDRELDAMSKAGLFGLSLVLRARTSVEPDDPMAVDPERDELIFFPLVYWPVLPSMPALSPTAIARIDRYLKTGGTILFDTRDARQRGPGMLRFSPEGERLKRLLRRLDIPALTHVPPDHVLTKAFYLLQSFPGRYDSGAQIWVEQRSTGENDGVSSVVIGGNDWASAWAIDEQGRPMAAVMPGGPAQRELAYRFGVNLVMYTLTGNYKADQVHVPAILERLGQ